MIVLLLLWLTLYMIQVDSFDECVFQVKSYGNFSTYPSTIEYYTNKKYVQNSQETGLVANTFNIGTGLSIVKVAPGSNCDLTFVGTYNESQSTEVISAINALTDGDIVLLAVTDTGNGFSQDVFTELKLRLGATLDPFTPDYMYVLVAQYSSTSSAVNLCEESSDNTNLIYNYYDDNKAVSCDYQHFLIPPTSHPTSHPTHPTRSPTSLGYLQNNDFESDSVAGSAYAIPTGWSGTSGVPRVFIVESGSDDWLNGTSCQSGSYCAGVQQVGSSLYQLLYVPNGYSVNVTFYLSGRLDQFSATGCTVTYGSLSLGVFSTTSSWVQQTVSIPANFSGARDDDLTFTQTAYSCSGLNCTFLIDSVSAILSIEPTATPTNQPTGVPSTTPTSTPTASPTRAACKISAASKSYYTTSCTTPYCIPIFSLTYCFPASCTTKYSYEASISAFSYKSSSNIYSASTTSDAGMIIHKSSPYDCTLTSVGTYASGLNTQLIAAIDALSDGDIVTMILTDNGDGFSSDVTAKLRARLGATVTSFPGREMYVLIGQYYSTQSGVQNCESGPDTTTSCTYTYTPLSYTSSPTLLPTPLPTGQPTSQPSPEYVPNFPEYVTISNMVVTSYASSADVSLTVQNYFVRSSGYVYCAAFEAELETEITSINTVKVAGSDSIYDLEETRYTEVHVVIHNLVALTSYDVFCYSETSSGVGLPADLVNKTRVQVETECCRGISFTSSPAYVYGDISKYNFISEQSKFMYSFSLDSVPSDAVDVVPLLYDLTGTFLISTDVVVMVPPSMAFTKDSQVLSESFYISTVNGSFDGNYTLVLNTTGASADEYYIVSTNVTILSSSAPPPAPVLVSAVFSESGASLILTFDSETNLASITSETWECTLLLSFTGASRTSCTWLSASVISVQLDAYDPSLSYVSVGSSISLTAHVLTAECCDSCSCSGYSSNTATTLTIAAPEDALEPRVNLIFPSAVSSCTDSIVIDPSSSVGDMGRDWTSIMWNVSVETTNSSYSVEPLQQYMNQHRDIASSISIPSQLFPDGNGTTESISLRLELTNYFGTIAVGSCTVTLVSNPDTPTLNIIGPRFLSITPADKLSIQSAVSFSSCASGGTPSLSYVWRVYDSDMNLLDLVSKSADKSKFSLSSYTLSPLSTYFVHINATVVSAGGSVGWSSNEVTVYVDHGEIEGVASGGYMRSDPEDRAITIDAGNSIDYDYGPSDSEGKLSYSWSCVFGEASSYGVDCNVFGSMSTTSSSLAFPANTLSSAHTYLFTFIVSSVSDRSRYDSKTVEVTPSVAGSPYVAIVSDVSKFNAGDKLYLDAEVQANDDVDVEWSIYQSPFNEELQASTPTSKSLSSFSASATVSFPLLCNSYSFVEGRTYTLRLTATSTGSGKSSSSFVTVLVNSAPVSGSTAVSPLEGDPLETQFVLQTSSWTDDSTDFPLSYSYYFQLSPNLDPLIISKRGYVPSVSFTLPYALETEDYRIDLVVYVFDIYDAAAESTVNVTMSDAVISLDDIGDLMGDALDTAFSSGNYDAASLVLNTLSSSINAVNCTLAPDCEAINRDSCLKTPQTCSSCKSGYIGVVGDSNVLCVSASTVTGQVGENCTANSDCVYDYCSQGVCEYPPLSCPSNYANVTCSGHGSCLYSDINGNSLASCTIGDTVCQAYCSCDTGYSGLDCSLSDDDALKKDALRNVICSGLVTLYESQDDSGELLDLLVTSMNSGYNPHEVITADTATVCALVLDNIQSMMMRGYVTDTTSPVVTSVADGISSFIDGAVISKRASSGSARRSLTQSGGSNTTSISNAMDGLVSALGSIMVEGEEPITLTSSNFRLKMTKQLMSDHASNASFSLAPPTTDAEAAYGATQPSISFANVTALASLCGFGSGYAEISLTKYGSNPYDSGNSSVASSMLSVGAAAGSSNVAAAVDYSTPLYYLVMPFATTQDFNLSIVDAVVAGQEYLLNNVTLPDCSIYNPNTGTYGSCGSCNISTFTNYNVTFACYDASDICPSSRRRLVDGVEQYRGLASTDDGAASTGNRMASQYAALLQAILDQLKQVMSANPFAINLEDAIAVLSFIGSITFIFLVGCSYLHSQDRRERAEMVEERRKLGAKSVKCKAFIKGAFPDEVFEKDENIVVRCAKTIANEHSMSVFFFSSSSMISSRLVKWLELWYGVLSTLFVDSVFYGVFFADTGVCELLPDELMCLSLQNQIFSTNQCGWTPPDDPETSLGTCSMLPPPKDVVFFTILSVVISIIGTFFAIIYKFCAIYVMSKRPDWGRYPCLFNTKRPMFFDPFELGTELSSDGKARVAAVVSLDKDALKLSPSEVDSHGLTTYLDMLSPNEEAFSLLESIQSELSSTACVDVESTAARQAASNQESFSLLRKLVKLNPDGTLAPLSLLHRLRYGDAFNKLVCKVKKIRAESAKLREKIDNIDKVNLPDKEYTLLQHFILTNCSFTSRVIVDKLMFDRDDALPPKIDPILWLASIFVLYGVLFYCLYYIFMWGVQNNGVTLNSWMINAGTSFAQDTLVTEPLSIIFLFIFVFDVAKIELKGIYHAINNSMMKYSKEAAQTKAGSTHKQQLKANNMVANSIIQIIAPACRVARTDSCKYLSFSHVLQRLQDDDMATVLGYHKSSFQTDGLFGIIVGIVMVMLLGMIVGPDTILGTVIPALVGGLTVAFVFLWAHLKEFIAVTVVLGSLLLLRYAVVQPLYRRGKLVVKVRRQRQKEAYYAEIKTKLAGDKTRKSATSSNALTTPSVFGILLGSDEGATKNDEKWSKSQKTTKSQSTGLLDSLGVAVFNLYTALQCRCKLRAVDPARRKEFSLLHLEANVLTQRQQDRAKYVGRENKDRVSELINFYWFHMEQAKTHHEVDTDSGLPVVTSLAYLNNCAKRKYVYVYENQRVRPQADGPRQGDSSFSSKWLGPSDPKPFTWDGGEATKLVSPVLEAGWDYAPDSDWSIDKAMPLSRFGWVFGQSFDDFKPVFEALKCNKRLREVKLKSHGPVRMRRWRRQAMFLGLPKQAVTIRFDRRADPPKAASPQPASQSGSSDCGSYSSYSDSEAGNNVPMNKPVATLDWFGDDDDEEEEQKEER